MPNSHKDNVSNLKATLDSEVESHKQPLSESLPNLIKDTDKEEAEFNEGLQNLNNDNHSENPSTPANVIRNHKENIGGENTKRLKTPAEQERVRLNQKLSSEQFNVVQELDDLAVDDKLKKNEPESSAGVDESEEVEVSEKVGDRVERNPSSTSENNQVTKNILNYEIDLAEAGYEPIDPSLIESKADQVIMGRPAAKKKKKKAKKRSEPR